MVILGVTAGGETHPANKANPRTSISNIPVNPFSDMPDHREVLLDKHFPPGTFSYFPG
jgi:hypothetical protein